MLRKLRNYSEHRVQRDLRAAVGKHQAELLEKVRIADVIDISQLDLRQTGTYALQAHFDFVIIDNDHMPVFAVEFDGPGHDAKNDEKKNDICQQADLPLIRIHGFEEVRDITEFKLTHYLVELVFHAREFLRMKENGEISREEPFMLSGFLRPDARHIFDSEFNFVGNANGKLTNALQHYRLTEDPLPHLTINRLTVGGQNGEIRCYVSIGSTQGPVVGTSRLRVNLASAGFLSEIGQIQMEIAEFAYGMAADDLLENLRLMAEGHGHMVNEAAAVLPEIKGLRALGYKLVMGSGGSRSEMDLVEAFSEGG